MASSSRTPVSKSPIKYNKEIKSLDWFGSDKPEVVALISAIRVAATKQTNESQRNTLENAAIRAEREERYIACNEEECCENCVLGERTCYVSVDEEGHPNWKCLSCIKLKAVCSHALSTRTGKQGATKMRQTVANDINRDLVDSISYSAKKIKYYEQESKDPAAFAFVAAEKEQLARLDRVYKACMTDTKILPPLPARTPRKRQRHTSSPPSSNLDRRRRLSTHGSMSTPAPATQAEPNPFLANDGNMSEAPAHEMDVDMAPQDFGNPPDVPMEVGYEGESEIVHYPPSTVVPSTLGNLTNVENTQRLMDQEETAINIAPEDETARNSDSAVRNEVTINRNVPDESPNQSDGSHLTLQSGPSLLRVNKTYGPHAGRGGRTAGTAVMRRTSQRIVQIKKQKEDQAALTR